MTNEKTEFTDALYDSGKRVVECLDKEGFNYPVVLWINLEDKGWKLLFGIPGLKLIGHNDILNNIKKIISENDLDLSADKLSVIDSHDIFCIKLKRNIKTGNGIMNLRLSATKVNGMMVPETVIYRVN
ncbi:MAG: hypothetical protein IPM96_16960 [Ignavibacteria bacterium]|nr:hypothetical protein [Ignavibacteria bacterium]